MLKGKTILLGVTGSIAAYKIAYLASALKKLNADVHVLTTSAFFARDTCSTLNSKFRSNVSTRHLLPVSVSKVIGLMKFTAFSVMST